MLSHKNRKDQAHILTTDPVLALDVRERISNDPRMSNLQLIAPESLNADAAVLEIEAMARETVDSRLIIVDVRRTTLPKLQKAHNQVVGFNRQDLNSYCSIVLIGDGPMTLFEPGKSLDVFVPHLSRMRLDYNPAAFFFDPFIHYTDQEVRQAEAASDQPRLVHVPERLVKALNKDRAMVADVRRYFRAASAPPAMREQTRKRREAKLVELYRRRAKRAFGREELPNLAGLFNGEGHRFTSEPLALRLYPLGFEDCVFESIERARTTATTKAR